MVHTCLIEIQNIDSFSKSHVPCDFTVAMFPELRKARPDGYDRARLHSYTGICHSVMLLDYLHAAQSTRSIRVGMSTCRFEFPLCNFFVLAPGNVDDLTLE